MQNYKLQIYILVFLILCGFSFLGAQDNIQENPQEKSLQNAFSPGLLKAVEPEISYELPASKLQKNKWIDLYIRYKIPPGYYQTYNKEFLHINFLDPSSAESARVRLGSLEYPPPDIIKGADQYYSKELILKQPVIFRSAWKSSDKLILEAGYQICEEDGTCFLPNKQNITVSGIELSAPPIGRFLLYLLAAIFGGLILNFMPCIFPLLSVKVYGLVKQGNNDRASIRVNAWLYFIGIEISFLLLASIMLLIKRAGRLLSWGMQMQNPWFVFILMSLMLIFSLALFGVYSLPQLGLKQRKGYLNSLVSGVFAVAVATPCSAPILGIASGFFFVTQDTSLGIYSMMFFVGLGMGFPYLLFVYFPQLVQKLPKPGKWMETFEQFTGIMLLAVILYLFNALISLVDNSLIYQFLLIDFLLVLIFWYWGRLQRKGVQMLSSWFSTIFLILSLGAIILTSKDLIVKIIVSEAGPSSQSLVARNKNYPMELYSLELLNRYRAEGRPVFVEYSAAWCSTCKINQITTLYRKTNATLFKEKQVAWLYADMTKYDERLVKDMARFNRSGVPLYLYYKAASAKPKILPTLLSSLTMRKFID